MLKISTAPHMHTDRTTASLMRDVVIALLPAAVAAVLFFWRRSSESNTDVCCRLCFI